MLTSFFHSTLSLLFRSIAFPFTLVLSLPARAAATPTPAVGKRVIIRAQYADHLGRVTAVYPETRMATVRWHDDILDGGTWRVLSYSFDLLEVI